MLKQYSVLEADKAQKYREMLSHHFARKVTVDVSEAESLVYFPMGECRMIVENNQLSFFCTAETQEALDAVKGVIDGHMHLLKQVRDTQLEWQSFE